jgi:FkbM family methyltransferase
MRIYSWQDTQDMNLELNSSFILANARAGKLLTILNDSVVSHDIRNLGHWAWNHVEIFKVLMHERGAFVDVGAYIGHHSVAILNFLEGEGIVVAIEGQPQIAQICAYNLGIQQYKNWCVFETVVDTGNNNYEIPLEDFERKTNFGSLSLISPQEEFGDIYIKVVSASLDQVLSDIRNINLIKLDVQYAELLVLKGGKLILERDLPHLFIEISPWHMLKKGNYDYRSIYHLLIGCGYRIFDVLGKPITQERNSNPSEYEPDFEWDIIAIHESKLEILRKIPWL